MRKKYSKGLRGCENTFLWLPSNWSWGSEQEGWREELGGRQRNDLFNKKWAIV